MNILKKHASRSMTFQDAERGYEKAFKISVFEGKGSVADRDAIPQKHFVNKIRDNRLTAPRAIAPHVASLLALL